MLVYLDNVKETEIYKAYGLTVSGEMHKYVWTIYGSGEEGILTTIRIKEDASGEDIFSKKLGGNGILQQRIDDTLDNFLFWIAEEKPDQISIEAQMRKALCGCDTFFNHSIEQKKRKKKEEKAEMARREEREKAKGVIKDNIRAYCNKKGLVPYFTDAYAYLIKANDKRTYDRIMTAENDDTIERYIELMQKQPDRVADTLVKYGTLEEIAKYVSQKGDKKHDANI